MKKTLYPFALCLLAVLTVRAQEPERTTTSLKVNVDLVELHVTVVDGVGRPIGGLKQEDFRITENSVNQPITIFKHEDIPVSLGLVLDNSRSIEPRKARLDAAALSFVEKSNPDDETFVVHFGQEAKLSQDFTGDRAVLDQQLRESKPFGQTALYDGIFLALNKMNEARYTKKALLLVTDGIDNASKSTLDEVVEGLKRERVMVFVVGLLSQSGGQQSEDSLIRIAEVSGGRAYFPETPEQARVAMEVIARDLRDQYTVAYLPKDPLRDGKWRSVRVDVIAPKGYPKDLKTTYRHGYYAPEQ